MDGIIQSYLANRKQCVPINGFESNLRGISCGVPPGSSLGPLLFLIYINDFRLCIEKTETGHFADYTFIMLGGKKLATIETVVNHELKLVTKWLRLNAGKIELIVFHSKQRSLNYISIKFMV